MRSVLYSGICLALALALVLALGTMLPQPAGVTAAPLPQRTRQPTSTTATPRITLPTDTPGATASPTVTGRGPTAIATGGAAVTDSPVVTVAAGTASVPGGPGGTGDPDRGGTPGAAAVATPGSPRSGQAPGPPAIGPPSMPGEGAAEEVSATAAPGALSGVDSGGGGAADAALLDAVPADVGPSGLVRVPVPDPRLRALWAAHGSPREGQGLAARFTEGRPGPWGFSLFYVLLVGLFGFVVIRLWGALGGLEGRDLEGQADPPEPDT